jgi:rare lipoprotein A
MNYTDNYANDGIVRIIGVVMTICGAAVLFIAGSSGAMAESGMASAYAYSGSKTASGERANPGGITAAHRTLAFGTHVRVTNKRNGRSVTVRINDRGPFVRGRVIDVTPAGARALGFSGTAPVKLGARSELECGPSFSHLTKQSNISVFNLKPPHRSDCEATDRNIGVYGPVMIAESKAGI